MENMENNAGHDVLVLSDRAQTIRLPIFRQIAVLAQTKRAVNLAGGMPDFPAPGELKQAAVAAIEGDYNQYSLSQGARELREGIAFRMEHRYGVSFDAETEITVCCGATEAMTAALMSVINPGDEAIIFDPAFPSYAAGVILGGGSPVPVKLRPPAFKIEAQTLEAAISPRTKAIIVNSPHNPTGRVFSPEELAIVAGLCVKHNLAAFIDETYDQLVYDNIVPVNLWKLPGMKERSVIVGGFSKTYSITGWRLGYVIAPASLTKGIRIIHNHMSLCAPVPLQMAAASATRLPDSYYRQLAATYQQRRDLLVAGLEKIGFNCLPAEGGYFVLADIRPLGWQDDMAFALHLVENIGVAAIPVSGFYSEPVAEDRLLVRFAFCKKEETLLAALARLEKLHG